MRTDTIPVTKNKSYIIEITGITSEGAGIGRVDGFSVFVPGALYGETVEALIIKINAGFAIGKLVKLIKSSSFRAVPVCPQYKRCGGCILQHATYEGQLEIKHLIVKDAIERIGGFAETTVLPVLPSPQELRYRNKAAFPCGSNDGNIVFGFYAARSHTLVPVDDCLLENEECAHIIQIVKEWTESENIAAYSETTHTGLLRHIVIRKSSSGETMVTLVCADKPKKEKTLVDKLAFVESIYWNINTKNTNVIFGDKFILLYGKRQIKETILGHTFTISPRTFLQVNHSQTEHLYKKAIELLAPEKTETAADIYCGMGSITLSLAPYVDTVFGIESVPEAIEDARRNAKENGIDNAEFYCGEAETVLPELFKDRTCDIMIIDPPRKGCDLRVLEAILSSACKRLVYVSCNPATLARDLKVLCGGDQFRIIIVQPVDMFPQTGHVETIALISRQKSQV